MSNSGSTAGSAGEAGPGKKRSARRLVRWGASELLLLACLIGTVVAVRSGDFISTAVMATLTLLSVVQLPPVTDAIRRNHLWYRRSIYSILLFLVTGISWMFAIGMEYNRATAAEIAREEAPIRALIASIRPATATEAERIPDGLYADQNALNDAAKEGIVVQFHAGMPNVETSFDRASGAERTDLSGVSLYANPLNGDLFLVGGAGTKNVSDFTATGVTRDDNGITLRTIPHVAVPRAIESIFTELPVTLHSIGASEMTDITRRFEKLKTVHDRERALQATRYVTVEVTVSGTTVHFVYDSVAGKLVKTWDDSGITTPEVGADAVAKAGYDLVGTLRRQGGNRSVVRISQTGSGWQTLFTLLPTGRVQAIIRNTNSAPVAKMGSWKIVSEAASY